MNARLSLRNRLGLPDEPRVIDLRDGHEQDLWVYPEPEPVRNEQLREVRFFGTAAFRRLWFSQLASSLGDWIGIIALTAIAGLTSGNGLLGLSGVSLVLATRLIPGLFFSPLAGVLNDHWDRRRTMVVTDFMRAAILCLFALYFATGPSSAALFVALIVSSLLLELVTLMWAPAKDASVPNIVSKEFLPKANSLSLAAAYGPLLIASPLYLLLIQVPDWIGATGIPDASIALYFDAFTYIISAAVIFTLHIPREKTVAKHEGAGSMREGFRQAWEGFAYIGGNAKVRSVMLGLATGLIGGAMIVPLGQEFASVVLNDEKSGYGVLLTGMGLGTALGVLFITIVQKRVSTDGAFVTAAFGAGIFLFLAASMSSSLAAAICIAGLGFCAGGVYVLAYSSVQLNTPDEMRGRVLTTFYTSTRVCIVIALVIAPLLAGLLDQAAKSIWTNGTVSIFGEDVVMSGVRTTLWLGSVIIVIAAFLALWSLRRGLTKAHE